MGDPVNFRDRLQGDLDTRYDALLKVIDDGLSATQDVWATCGSCSKRTLVTVTDTRAALACAEFVANQSHGRPGVDDRGGDAEQERIVFERVLHLTDGELERRVTAASLEFVPAESREAFLAACGLGGAS